ncbi:MAG: hypothetical protein V3V47_00325 [Desulfobacteria bacterium]
MNRDTAEWLVDLLEEANPFQVGIWRIDLAYDIRRKFGMKPMEEYADIRWETIEHFKSKGKDSVKPRNR